MTLSIDISTQAIGQNVHHNAGEAWDVTVAICAYNAEQRIGAVLESLARQTAPERIRWELLVIDNNSRDQTSDVVREGCARLGLPVRLLHEATPGLAHARRLASLEARAPVISFLDDDTLVAEDWVERCAEFMEEHAEAGIIGARVEPLFEDPSHRPADFDERFAGILSMYDQGSEPRKLNVTHDPTPVGAGMTGRREIFRFVFADIGSLTIGRKGESLAGGEDIEAMFLAQRMGWEIWYAPSLRLEHMVPSRKLTEAYRDKWCIDTGRCQAWLLVFSGREPLRPLGRHRWMWLKLRLLVLKYVFLGGLPEFWHPKLQRSGFWREFYRTRAAGYKDLLRQHAMAEVTLKAADEMRERKLGGQASA